MPSAHPYAKTTTPSKFRHSTEAEMQEKREKGICFRCDEKFGLGYRCKKKELQVLLVYGDELEVKESIEANEEEANIKDDVSVVDPSSMWWDFLLLIQ